MREKSLFLSTNTLLTMKKDQNMEYNTSKQKQVHFDLSDDVVYIYPWSPTKYLLFGKYSEEQLKNKRVNQNTDCAATTILKKTQLHGNGNNIGYDTNRSTNDELSSVYKHPFQPHETYLTKSLEEIYISEAETSKHPTLPKRAIFSPNHNKEMLSNTPLSKNTAVPSKFKESNKIITLNKDSNVKSCRTAFPYIPSKMILSDAFFGCMKTSKRNVQNISTRMPSINKNHCRVVPKRQAPRSQLSHRYAIIETDLDNIQHLHEEEISFTERPSSRQVRPLPSISDQVIKQKNIRNNEFLNRHILAPLINKSNMNCKEDVKISKRFNVSPSSLSPRFP